MLKKTVRLALFTSILLLNASPALASTVDVVGNGADSSNTANVTVAKTTNIFQTNTGNVNNSVTVKPNTGDNSANKNTGGDTGIATGDATGKVAAANDLNHNTSSLACCNGADGFAVKVSGNGADSENNVNLDLTNSLSIVDQKTLKLENNFKVDPNTGGNKSDKNTGGNSSITTGDAFANITIGNVANINKITVGNAPVATTPVPGTNPIPNPPVASTPGSVLGAVAQLPNTGFDYSTIILAIVGLVGSGLVLRAKSEALDDLVRSTFVRI